MAYLLIIVLTIRSSIKVFKREIGYDWKFTSVFIAWVAFLTQSLISVNQLGLGIWGWTLTGLLIGYEINTRNSDKGPNQNSTQGTGLSGNVSLGETKTDWDIVLFSTFGLILGTVIALTPFRNSVELYSLVGEVNVSAVESLGTRDSINPEIAVILAANLEKDFEESALKIIRNTVKNYPDSYAAWKFFSNLRGATSQEIAQAQIQMKRLDPLNPELK